ncbi:MAG TPA: 30S ribosomal protein S3ae [Thermoplasmata archaeon]|nr:30S ribosomal protein S3ae [Thermoplasmata archaeon]
MAEKETPAKKPALARTVKDKWRSKHWFKIRAPGLFQHVDLGETAASEPEQIVGRTLEATLPELSGASDTGKAHVKLRFRIERLTGDGYAEARFIGHDLTTDYVRRLARRKRSKIDQSLTVTTKDGVEIVLKPVAVGEQRLQTRLRAELRHRVVEVLTEEAKLRTSAEFVQQMIQGELSKLLAHGVKSLYPLKKIEIRRSIVLGVVSDEIPTAPPAEVAPEGPAAPGAPAEPVPAAAGEGSAA